MIERCDMTGVEDGEMDEWGGSQDMGALWMAERNRQTVKFDLSVTVHGVKLIQV